MIRYPLSVLFAVLWVASAGAAIDCVAEPPSGKGHWSWRTIDGKKCWYQGRPGISKDKLRWPAATVGQRGDQGSRSASRAAAKADPPPEAADTQPARDLTFMERWRAMMVR